LVDSLLNESIGDAHQGTRWECMKLVGDGCSDPLNRAFEEDLSSSSVDASERVVIGSL
jgi:hypothetical protein